MNTQEKIPYGSWKSPITSDKIASGMIRLEQVALDGENIYWIEMRPSEGGRSAIMRYSPDSQMSEVIPAPFNVRTRVHEYGGGAFVIDEETVYFSNFTDQRIYRSRFKSMPKPITPEGLYRYADGVLDRLRNRLICVCEDHSRAEVEPVNTLTSIDIHGKEHYVMVSGNNFYSSPRLSPDGSKLAWLTWNHPCMPWDGTELWVGNLNAKGRIRNATRIAGSTEESIFQPEWSPDGTLYFVSDRSDWWNIYGLQRGCIEPVIEMELEFGAPQWFFGMSTYAFVSADTIVCTYNNKGTWHLASIFISANEIQSINTRFTDISYLRAGAGKAVFIGGSPSEPASIVRIDLQNNQTEILRSSTDIIFDSDYISIPRAVEFPSENGIAHAFYHPPQNKECRGPDTERPPLIVISHGGPTSAVSTKLDYMTQFWTSRGFAVINVNYGGSTGYGRSYRQRLNGEWGNVDVDDCVNGATHLVNVDEVDENRLIIRGGSAGGYTTLCALAFRDVFSAGADYYGVSDLESMRKETHKFESHYLDRLIATYSESSNVYYNRSPINFADHISCPVIFFQGLEDKIVPPVQTESIFNALKRKGLHVAYFPFAGEQHGFRRSENIKRALDAELSFYAEVFYLRLPDSIHIVKK